MRAQVGRLRARAGGQAITEFALVAPIFILVVFALIELGRAVFYTQILDSTARDGARYAIVNGFEVSCPSGPLPPKGLNPNYCDLPGNNVIATVRDRAVGVVDANGPGFVVHVKWCDTSSMLTPGASQCGLELPCAAWGTDAFPLGDGDNGRGQLAAVCITYSYESLFKIFLPVPDFTVSARSDLVVNH